MNPTMTRLNSMTVAQLREIGREMRINGLSKCRKAELVVALACFIDGEHATALIANDMYEPTMRMVKAAERLASAGSKVSLIDFPAVDGRVVTEAHAKICRERGCSTYVKNGIDMGFCPRCGEVSTSEDQITDEEIKSGVIVPDMEIIPAMLSEYGYSAHGNTYAIDYNRVHVSVYGESLPNLFKKEETISDDITIDAFLAKAEAAIKPLAEFASEAERVQWENDSDEAEQWTTVAKDLTDALANVEWMLRYRANR